MTQPYHPHQQAAIMNQQVANNSFYANSLSPIPQGRVINGMYGGARHNEGPVVYKPNPNSCFDPYYRGFPLTASGKLRVPNREEVTNSIKEYLGILNSPLLDKVVYLDEAPEFIRHCCVSRPFYHEIPRNFVDFTIDPTAKSLIVWFYAHVTPDCNKLYIYLESY